MFIKLLGTASPTDNVLLANHAPAIATAAIVTLAAVSGKKKIIHSIQWSYDTTPTAGNLSVARGATIVWSEDISAAGPGGFDVTIPGNTNEAVTVTLASAGAGVTGKVNVQYTLESTKGTAWLGF